MKVTLRERGIGRIGALLIGAGLCLLLLLAVGIVPRLQRQRDLEAATSGVANATPVVSVAAAKQADASSNLVLPGTTEPLREAIIYARTNGYVRRRYVDIGDRVKAGQLLAVIESPEVDQDLFQAQANLKRVRANLTQARANLEFARTTLKRWKDLEAQGVVAHQDVDERQTTYRTREAELEQAESSVRGAESAVRRLETTQAFSRITAPFPGMITARNVDAGALITSGSTNSTTSLFTLQQTDVVRIFVSVPQAFVAAVKSGQTAQILVDELPRREFVGKVVRTAGALDPASRTLRTELQVPNGDHALLPGMYVRVKFAATVTAPPVLIPAATLLVRADGPQVATVGADRTVRFKKIELGRDYGTEVEVRSGITPGETLIVSPPDEVREGTVVQVAQKAPAAQAVSGGAVPAPAAPKTQPAASPVAAAAPSSPAQAPAPKPAAAR